MSPKIRPVSLSLFSWGVGSLILWQKTSARSLKECWWRGASSSERGGPNSLDCCKYLTDVFNTSFEVIRNREPVLPVVVAGASSWIFQAPHPDLHGPVGVGGLVWNRKSIPSILARFWPYGYRATYFIGCSIMKVVVQTYVLIQNYMRISITIAHTYMHIYIYAYIYIFMYIFIYVYI